MFREKNSRDWIGEVDEKGTVAYSLKKYFRIDLTKDTGFHKTRWERLGEFLLGLGKQVTVATLTTIVAALVGFAIGFLLGKG